MIYLKATSTLYNNYAIMTLSRAIRFSWFCEKYTHFRLVRHHHWHWSLTFQKPTLGR